MWHTGDAVALGLALAAVLVGLGAAGPLGLLGIAEAAQALPEILPETSP
jgi:hypothetical protein